jgi:hypothetical protein
VPLLHIVNQIAKSLLKQFDVPEKSADAALDDTKRKLINLAAGIDIEEMATIAKQGAGSNSEDKNDVEGWVDETASMSVEEREELCEKVQPVHLVLVKVSLCIWISQCQYSLVVSSANLHTK